MSNNLIKIFEKEELGKIRVQLMNGIPYFCLKDVCDILHIANPSKLATRLNQDGITSSYTIDNMGRNQPTLFIDEENLYATIFQSRKPQAKEFQRWVFGEVLPSVRQNGFYVNPNATSINADMLMSIATKMKELETTNQNLLNSYNDLQEEYYELEEENENLELWNNELEPKAEFYDIVIESGYTYNMGYVSKTLNYKNLGRNRLFRILRQNNILNYENIPYQRYVDSGYFKTNITYDNKGYLHKQTVVTMKGIEYINNLLSSLGYKRMEEYL